ncbi:uncharacterized protein LOC122305295 [Carya illinoinensis]|uniref:uncharacterized protein LOC122305295 n=1 Tax=Carya illinoinensis TaxID=32201 RepID=UPI001C7233B3|nr:uncharacterized protein LOC122305295 [Carya illinoinensis]XP_042973639.1 uncharacterized protein LOC122305295 [Carya illinoinensis]
MSYFLTQARFGCLTICFHLRGSSSCLSNGVKVHHRLRNVVEDAFGLIWQTLICLRILKLESRSDKMRHARLRRRKQGSMMINLMMKPDQRRKSCHGMLIPLQMRD